MNSWAVRGWLLLAVVLALAYGGWIARRVGPDLERADATAHTKSAEPIHDFTLTDQTGQPFGTSQLRGQVWVASFFFASCPGTCRQLNMSLASVGKQVPADVRFVSVTCDPDIDTPQTLALYAQVFAADPQRWKFLTGDMRDLERVGRDIFQVALAKQTHTEKAFVVDRQGYLRGRFNVLDSAQAKKLVELVKQLDAAPAADAAPAPDSASPADAAPAADTTPGDVRAEPARNFRPARRA